MNEDIRQQKLLRVYEKLVNSQRILRKAKAVHEKALEDVLASTAQAGELLGELSTLGEAFHKLFHEEVETSSFTEELKEELRKINPDIVKGGEAPPEMPGIEKLVVEGEKAIQGNMAKYGRPSHPDLSFKPHSGDKWPNIECRREGGNADFMTSWHHVKVRFDETSGNRAPFTLRLYAYQQKDASRFIKQGEAWTWHKARDAAELMLKEAMEQKL